jgi:ADP-heptose:LPS heptosyltransferase
MTLNLVPLLKQRYPDHEIDYYCDPNQGDKLSGLMEAAGVSQVIDCAQIHHRVKEYEQAINLVGYPLHEGYPERPMRRHLLQYFGEEMGLEVRGDLPRLQLDQPSRFIGSITDAICRPLPKRYVTLHAQAGWSHYKNWPFKRWEAVIASNPDIPVFQIGTETDCRVGGADWRFMGTHLSVAIALIAHATMHLGVDSFTNHLTHYEWRGKGQTPAVIIWGSTQYTAAGYPHNVNLQRPLPCQPCFRENPAISKHPRGPCINPPGQVYEQPRPACMDLIAVDEVNREVRRLWESLQ